MGTTNRLIDVSQNADPTFLLAQKELTIHMKDGYSFFRANAKLLTERFSDPTKTTNIIVVHPDSHNMMAVADMDDNKLTHTQRSDCLQAVKVLHGIRDTLQAEGQDITERVMFVGQDNVPTWNGFVGDKKAMINLYNTRPYRGKLPSIKAVRNGKPSSAMMYQWAVDDTVGRLPILQATRPDSNLWSFKLPAEFADLRR